jgi:hypothetical protein
MAAGCGESHGGAEKLLSGSTAESAAAAAAAAMASIQERKHQAETRRGLSKTAGPRRADKKGADRAMDGEEGHQDGLEGDGMLSAALIDARPCT